MTSENDDLWAAQLHSTWAKFRKHCATEALVSSVKRRGKKRLHRWSCCPQGKDYTNRAGFKYSIRDGIGKVGNN